MEKQAWEILLAAYLLGSFPSAYLVTHLIRHKDIRKIGDGNMGAKNTLMSVGILAGIIVGVLDLAKGALAVALARYFSSTDEIVLLAGACAILGHDFPLFLRFKGGQGMATMAGVFIMLFPLQMALVLCALIFTLLLFHNWDLSCAVACVLLVVLLWLMGQPPRRIIYTILLLPTLGVTKLIQALHTRDAMANR